MRLVLVSLSCVLSIHLLFSQEEGVTGDSILLRADLHPIVLVSSEVKLPNAVSLITRKQIEALKEPLIEPLLNATPGLWMQSGTLNTNRISVRGVGYREPFATTGIKVYLDEIPLTNGSGEASIEDIHPLILSGIEILRGPSSALWGAGLGGMILLKSDIPNTNTFQARVQVGSYKRLQSDQHVSLRYGKHDQWGTVMHYQYMHDDGFRENNEYNKHSFTWIQHWQNDQGWSVQAFLHRIALKAFIPSSLTQSDYNMRPQIAAPTWEMVKGNEDYTKWITGLTFGYASAKQWIYRGSVFGTWFTSDEVRPFNVLDESNTAFGTRHRIAWRIRDAGHLTAGMEYYRDQYEASTFETLSGGVRGAQLTNARDHRSYLHVFSQSQWNVIRRGHVFAGVSSSISQLSADTASVNVPTSIFPTAGIQFALTHKITLSASLSRGYSALALSQVLNSDGSIQSDIKPETGWSREVSVAFNQGPSFTAKVTGYIMDIRNTIITRRIMDDIFERYNGGETRHRGVEAELNISDKLQRIRWTGSYTYNAHVFSRFNDGGVDFSGNTLPGSPAHHLFQTLGLHILDALSFSLNHHWVSDVYLNDANTVRGSGYHLLNTSLDYRFKTGEKLQWVASVHLHNVLDTQYSPMFQINAPGGMPRYYYPGKPRSVYVSLGVEYKIRR